MYISRLVKTRDLYPGLLQFAITCFLSFFSLPFYLHLFLFLYLFHLYLLVICTVEVLLCPFHSQGT
jgi:hypothetical protein